MQREQLEVAGRQFTVSIEQEGGWWIGLVWDLPGCGSQGGTLDELRDMLADAIQEYLTARGELNG